MFIIIWRLKIVGIYDACVFRTAKKVRLRQCPSVPLVRMGLCIFGERKADLAFCLMPRMAPSRSCAFLVLSLNRKANEGVNGGGQDVHHCMRLYLCTGSYRYKWDQTGLHQQRTKCRKQ